MEKKSIVRIQNISKTYQAENGEVEALKGINFDVKEGEFISIIGPSGCGKSSRQKWFWKINNTKYTN